MSRVKYLLIWAVCFITAVVALIWLLLAVVVKSPRAVVIALGFDQLGNAVGGGDEDMLFSTRCWINREQPRYALLLRLVNWAFNDPNHCENSYKSEKSKQPL